MPIAAPGKTTLGTSIERALRRSREAGKSDNADSDAVISQLASDLTSAIDAYVTSIVVTINPGQVVQAVGQAGPSVGSTITPGTS
jgi:hypothetical protein